MSDDLDFIESGVAEIAEGMGFGKTDEESTEEQETLQDDGSGDEDTELQGDEDTDAPIETEEKTERAQPTSWAKEKAELWSKTPDDVKDYIEQRESQMLEGINHYRDGYRYGEHIAKAIQPYRAVIEAGGGDEATAIMNLFEHHKAITEGTLEQRQQAFIQIGIATGLIPQEGSPDPKVSQLEQRLSAFERQQKQEQQRQQQQSEAKIQKQVQEFAKDKPDFDDLSDEIALLLQKGHDLETAYKEAKWLNPTARQKEIDRLSQEKQKARQEEALKAKKAAGVNINPASTKTKATQPKGKLFQDLGSVYDSMVSGNS